MLMTGWPASANDCCRCAMCWNWRLRCCREGGCLLPDPMRLSLTRSE